MSMFSASNGVSVTNGSVLNSGGVTHERGYLFAYCSISGGSLK
jgi:hypothetical protein